MKPKFPAGEELEETAAIMRVLEAVAGPVSPGGLRSISPTRQIEKRVGLAVAALARLGHLSRGGKKVSLGRGTYTLQVLRANHVLRKGKGP